MLKIVALNEVETDEATNDEEGIVTNEAQETIAETEYMRAIKLRYNGQLDDSLSLLNELLQTKVLNELCNNKKLWNIRYNCHKNIAMIYEEKREFDLALHNYTHAVQIDKTDVHMLHKFGQLALKCDALEVAEFAFESCLQRNPSHSSAADGLLRTLCHRYNVLAAYGLALKLFRRDNNYMHAAKVLSVIHSQFEDLMDVYWPQVTRHELALIEKLVPDNAYEEVFPSSAEKNLRQPVVVYPQNIAQFRKSELNWLTIGDYLTQVYKYLADSQQSMLYTMDFQEMLASESSPEMPEANLPQSGVPEKVDDSKNASTREENCMDNELSETNEAKEIVDESPVSVQGDAEFASPVAEGGKTPTIGETAGNNDDSDSNTKSDSNDGSNNNNKPKVKRRCSDLHMLEQWGWHKSRRYSARKKTQDRPELDTSLNSFLRRIFTKFTRKNYEDSWPFNEEFSSNAELHSETNELKSCEVCAGNQLETLEEFDAATKCNFEEFVCKLKSQKFDLMFLMFEWLRYISALFHLKLPQVVRQKYVEIFQLYFKHCIWSNWNQMPDEDLEASYGICLFNLELEHEELLNSDRQVTQLWHDVFNHLMLHSGVIYVGSKHRTVFLLRLVHLQYMLNRYEKNFDVCINCFDHMSQLMADESNDYTLHLPNQMAGCITKKSIKQARFHFERRLLLTKVPSLFKSEKWSELIDIITANMRTLRDHHECENWSKDFRVQIELLLNAFWHSKAYENCILWADMFLHYTTDQYLKEARTSTYRQKLWAQSINFILSYIESIVLDEGYDILLALNERLSRLVQNIIRLLAYQLDAPIDKHITTVHDLDIKRPWTILHQIMVREECQQPVLAKLRSTTSSNSDSEQMDEEEMMPNSFLLLFTAHQFLGRRQWCTQHNGEFLCYILDVVTPNLRAPLYDGCRDAVYENIEQITYCLYGYPQKKARLRHLEEHESQQQELNWSRAMQIFALYKPECLPEFNSYKLESITADFEQLLLKIIALIPKDVCPARDEIAQVLASNMNSGDFELDKNMAFTLPYQINSIFYLLADYYFKNRDFIKAIKFYTFDLACNPVRFDSWAGMALSKASRIETKLNGLTPLNFTGMLAECDDVLRCFERCISLNRTLTLLWIEYGTFAYTIHSYCSRHLKHESEKLSIEHFSYAEDRKNKMLSIAYDCFSLAGQLQEAHAIMNPEVSADNGESNEEKWLCQYMLGKIAEKRKDEPQIYLNCYLKAAKYLYESNATYPIKINHSNPTTLSVEALEVFYRTNSAIIKFVEHSKDISPVNGLLIKNVLNNLSNSPFAYNKAKIDGNSLNALKRKINDKQVTSTCIPPKVAKPTDQNLPSTLPMIDVTENENVADKQAIEPPSQTSTPQEISTAVAPTSTTASSTPSIITTTTTSTSDSSSSTTSTSSDSDNDSTSIETEAAKNSQKGESSTALDLDMIYKRILQNLEECITRFPEHYKSIYRLVHHYLNSPSKYCDYKRCEELLLGQYRTALGNQINGLFGDRKNNNLFNGIWRIPSSEIDRPGSFSAQLVKCVSILIQVLMKNNNHKLLIDVGLQLFKSPDNDKRYIKDSERLELYQQSIDFCTRIMQNTLRQHVVNRNDAEILTLLIDLYRIHKKCQKYMNQKEPQFCQLMVDAYKLYVQDKIEVLPENLNFFDLAIKLCIQEIGLRKNIEKAGTDIAQVEAQVALTRKNNIPGLLMRRGRVPSLPKVTPGLGAFMPQLFEPQTFNQELNLNEFISLQPDPSEFRRLCEEYYTKICNSGQVNPVPLLNYEEALLALAHNNDRKTSDLNSLAMARSAAGDNKPSGSTVITTAPSSMALANMGSMASGSSSANMNLLQKLPSSLDVTALMSIKAPAAVMPIVPFVDATVTVTTVHGANNKEIPLNELSSLGASKETDGTGGGHKIKRPTKKARHSPYHRPTVTEAVKMPKNMNTIESKTNYLDYLAKSRQLTAAKRNFNPYPPNMGNDNAIHFTNSALYNTSIIPVVPTTTTSTTATSQMGLQKTLQQKLVERQKANALNDMKQTQKTAADSNPTIDVICID